jgi:glyoxylase-like metal-dependent hydrolase (beta-lactamase superfamily II)
MHRVLAIVAATALPLAAFGQPGGWNDPFPPHRVMDNLYYVGTSMLSSFLITTPEGHILVSSNYESSVPVIRANVEALGFDFEDIAVLLSGHAHPDHIEGDALVKELTGAEVVVGRLELPAQRAFRTPSGRALPIDRIVDDGDRVSLGGTTLTAHLLPGHTQGCLAWSLDLEEGGRDYYTLIECSLNGQFLQYVENTEYPAIVADMRATYARARALPVEVFLSSHGVFYGLDEKYAALLARGDGEPNPFVDPDGYRAHVDEFERTFEATLAQQLAAVWSPPLTPWGDPDISGSWPIAHLIGTPLERPARFGERRLMNDEEFAAVVASVEQRNTRYDAEIASNRMGGGHWAEPTEALRLTSLIVDPADGRLPAMTAAGQSLQAVMGSGWSNTVFDGIQDFDSWDRCITRGLPVSMLPRNYNNGIRILQSPGFVAITLEMAHETRVIPVDGRPPLDPEIVQWLGESRGRFEGKTLVVETTNFNGLTSMTNPGVPGSPNPPTPTTRAMRIVERFTPTGADTMDYTITIEEPVVLTRSWTAAYPMQRDEGYRSFEFACHEGNSAVRNYIETSRFERGQRP